MQGAGRVNIQDHHFPALTAYAGKTNKDLNNSTIFHLIQ